MLFAPHRGYLTVILSCIYAIFILMLGVVVYIADLISRTATMAEVREITISCQRISLNIETFDFNGQATWICFMNQFNDWEMEIWGQIAHGNSALKSWQVFSVYLVVLGLLWLIFLYCDIRRHQKVMRRERSRSEGNLWSDGKSDINKEQPYKRASSGSPSTEEADMGSEDAISHVSIPVPPRSVESKAYNVKSYTFCRSRHSGSFYLKIGAAGKTRLKHFFHINMAPENATFLR